METKILGISEGLLKKLAVVYLIAMALMFAAFVATEYFTCYFSAKEKSVDEDLCGDIEFGNACVELRKPNQILIKKCRYCQACNYNYSQFNWEE